MQSRIKNIRKAEKDSHLTIYSKATLFEKGTWLEKPIKTIMDILPYLNNHNELNVLDLGCGIGRNSIPIAQRYKENCHIDCVDILDFAIIKLLEYCEIYNVLSNITGIISGIEEFNIKQNKYNLIMSVSALEHVYDEKSFCNKLNEIKYGVVENGIVCLVINSEVKEENKETHAQLEPQFEVNMMTDKLKMLLNDMFNGWKILKYTESNQNYEIPREECIVNLSTTVVTIVAQNI